MCNMFSILYTISLTGYSGDNIPFVVRDNTATVIEDLEEISQNLQLLNFNFLENF